MSPHAVYCRLLPNRQTAITATFKEHFLPGGFSVASLRHGHVSRRTTPRGVARRGYPWEIISEKPRRSTQRLLGKMVTSDLRWGTALNVASCRCCRFLWSRQHCNHGYLTVAAHLTTFAS